MKFTSKKLLLWLYPFEVQNKRRVPYAEIGWLFPELTEDGYQSLARHLTSEQLIFTDELDGYLSLTLSSHGRTQLEADFPALKRVDQPWQGDWYVIVFLSAPKLDKSFRYLRTQLVKNLCYQLSRGVYLHAGKIGDELLKLFHDSYRENVVVYKTDKWLFGDDQIVIGQSSSLKDQITIFSGISKEVEALLTKKTNKKALSNQQKTRMCSIFDRFVAAFEQDVGIINYYHPTAISGTQLLRQIRQE